MRDRVAARVHRTHRLSLRAVCCCLVLSGLCSGALALVGA
jgi:hypothetical protein